MERQFDFDFRQVRIHADSDATERVGARAYAARSRLVFAPGEYSPATGAGRRLIAHELAHVVQRSRGGPPGSGAAAVDAEREADRAADTVLAGGALGQLTGRPAPVARKAREYQTGRVTGKDGWTYVAYLDQGFVRLVYRVDDKTPDRRIGNKGWATNNPGSLDLSRPTITRKDPTDPSRLITTAAPEAARVAVKHGAYEKNRGDIDEFQRLAVFPTQEMGGAAIQPLLESLAKPSPNSTVDGLLRVYVRGTPKAGKPDTVGDDYVRNIRRVLSSIFMQRRRLTAPDLPEAERKGDADALTEGLMARQFLSIPPGSMDMMALLEAVLRVESTRDMARIGLEYGCKGWRNQDEVEQAYARDTSKLNRIKDILDSAAVKAQLDVLLGCASQGAA